MSKQLPVTTLGHPVLRLRATPIGAVTDAHRTLAERMTATMFAENGVGIAAPQVGQSLRLVILRFNTEGRGGEEVFAAVNPEILERSEETVVGEEGCLSVPNIYGPVERARSVTFTYRDLDGAPHTRSVQDFDARIIQHEIDHLDGVLFIDRVTDRSKLVRYAPGEQPEGAI